MYQLVQLSQLEDYFLKSSQRKTRGVYFYRIINYNTNVEHFFIRYFQEARKNGVVLEGKINNPTDQNLAYFREILGSSFVFRLEFFQQQLQKWLPRLDIKCRNDVAEAMYTILKEMAGNGKNENMLKNAYIKFMCWMYYRFERVLQLFGKDAVPKILYEGSVTYYELELLRILSKAGCDIVLFDKNGDEAYRKLDAASAYSYAYVIPEGMPFPEDYTVRKSVQQAQVLQQAVGNVQGQMNDVIPKPCINAWMSGDILTDLQKPVTARGTDNAFYYTMFARLCGVEDKASYLNMLLQLYLNLTGAGRTVFVLEHEIPKPVPGEINQIRRRNYSNLTELSADLAQNIICGSTALQQLLRQQFILFLQEEPVPEGKLNRLLNRAVYLLCWLRRYQEQLFGQWKQGDVNVFLFLSHCQDEMEVFFIRYLSHLPLDIVIFSPNLNLNAEIKDKFLYVKKYTISMSVEHYPTEGTVQLGTVAYHAEQELTETLYQDSGLYREQQYQAARAVALQTMYEEIYILWEQEERYRPNFDIVQDEVLMPVIFAKVSGVKDGDIQTYWRDVKKLLIKDAFFVSQVPFVNPADHNPMKQYGTEFYRNGSVQKQKIKQHKAYPYQYLREEIQDYMLEKLQQLVDLKLIQGTFQNGTEYTIVATVLNLDKMIVRLIQKMDFTKVVPKLVLVHTGEAVYSLEDSIMVAYLHLIGFDIVLYSPTGYRSLEQYFNQQILTEHTIGEYVYDLRVPEKLTDTDIKRSRPSWRDRILGKGR